MFEAVLSVQILIPGNSIYPTGLIGAPIPSSATGAYQGT